MVVVTLGQQYNVGEQPTVIPYTYNNRHTATPDKHKKNTEIMYNDSRLHHHTTCGSNNIQLRYIIGYKDRATTWYINGFPDGNNLGSTV